MPEETKTCQGKIWDKEDNKSKPCNRPLHDGKYCICHSKDINKDIELLRAEVQKQIDRKDYHDFTEFVFPKEYSFENIRFVNDVYFRFAEFANGTNFVGGRRPRLPQRNYPLTISLLYHR